MVISSRLQFNTTTEECPQTADRVFILTAFTSALLLNWLYLILIRENTSFGIIPYKRLLLISCISDIIAALLDGIVFMVSFFSFTYE
jgi:hypothetical protein